MTTEGEYRVGITFNPSGDDLVTRIKRAAADLIDLIEGMPSGKGGDLLHDERWRLKNLASAAIEDGAMWAVKAATKQPVEGGAFAAPAAAPAPDPFVGLVKEALEQFSPKDGPRPHPALLMQEISRFLEARGFKHVAATDINLAIDTINFQKRG